MMSIIIKAVNGFDFDQHLKGWRTNAIAALARLFRSRLAKITIRIDEVSL